jgi:hypothetical protein
MFQKAVTGLSYLQRAGVVERVTSHQDGFPNLKPAEIFPPGARCSSGQKKIKNSAFYFNNFKSTGNDFALHSCHLHLKP